MAIYLYGQYAHPSGSNLPVVMLLPGISQQATDFEQVTLERIAAYGVFACSVSMRHRNYSGGTQDCSARETYDIYDILAYIRANFASVVDADYAAIAGYSGGGGNALNAACKFPDTWAVVVSCFGISDYGVDAIDGWYDNGALAGDQTLMDAWIGGNPAAVPDAYRARNAAEGIASNYTAGHLYLFHDDQDARVPVVNSENVGAAMLAAGLANYTESYTTLIDNPRWLHNLPNGAQPIIQTEPVWAAAVAAKTHAVWTVPANTTHRVIGYIKTKRYECWLGTTTKAGAGGGLDEVADVLYGVIPNEYTVTPLTGACDVYIEQADGKTGTASGITEATPITVS